MKRNIEWPKKQKNDEGIKCVVKQRSRVRISYNINQRPYEVNWNILSLYGYSFPIAYNIIILFEVLVIRLR